MAQITVTIDVTAEHIQSGQQCDGRWCPIAHAFRAAGFQYLDVNGDGVYANRKSDGQWFDFKLPSVAKMFVWSFDSIRESVQPFTFAVDGTSIDDRY